MAVLYLSQVRSGDKIIRSRVSVRVYRCSRRDPRRFVGVVNSYRCRKDVRCAKLHTGSLMSKLDINCKNVMEVPALKGNGGGLVGSYT